MRTLQRAFVTIMASIVTLIAAPHVLAEPTTAPATQPAGAPFEMESFTLVVLVTGDNPPKLTNEQSAELQKQHIAHLTKLGLAGKILVAGPLANQPDKTWRGICVYGTSLEEAKALASDDP